jgi:hypothetical protein
MLGEIVSSAGNFRVLHPDKHLREVPVPFTHRAHHGPELDLSTSRDLR